MLILPVGQIVKSLPLLLFLIYMQTGSITSLVLKKAEGRVKCLEDNQGGIRTKKTLNGRRIAGGNLSA